MPFWLLGAFGWLRRAAQGAWTLATRYPLAAALIVALLACGWMWRGWNRADERAAKWEAATLAWKDANAKATRWAKAEAKRKDDLATTAKDTANDNRRTVQAAAASAGADYAARNRCVLHNPAKGRFERTDLPRPDSAPGQPADEADDARVAVDNASFNACTVNSADLLNAYEWGQDLVAKGLAK